VAEDENKEPENTDEEDEEFDEGQLTGCMGLARQAEPWPGYWESRKKAVKKNRLAQFRTYYKNDFDG
jgi:hypothetical protein